MSERSGFELEPDAPKEPAKPGAPPPGRPSPEGAKPPPTAAAEASGLLSYLGPRLRKRLVRVVPGMAIVFLVVGWLFVGTGVWVFPLVGAAVGVYASFRRPEEAVLGSVAAAAGFGTTLAVAGFRPGLHWVLVIASCAVAGAVTAIDDRLSGL